jgi:hypothetical protein
VRYDDGDVEEVDLANERMEFLEPGGVVPVANPGSGSEGALPAAMSVAANGDVLDSTKPPGWWPVVWRCKLKSVIPCCKRLELSMQPLDESAWN